MKTKTIPGQSEKQATATHTQPGPHHTPKLYRSGNPSGQNRNWSCTWYPVRYPAKSQSVAKRWHPTALGIQDWKTGKLATAGPLRARMVQDPTGALTPAPATLSPNTSHQNATGRVLVRVLPEVDKRLPTVLVSRVWPCWRRKPLVALGWYQPARKNAVAGRWWLTVALARCDVVAPTDT